MEPTINKIQINAQTKTDKLGNVLERSTLINIRCDDVLESVQLFNQLRLRLNNAGQQNFNPEPLNTELPESLPDPVIIRTCPECGIGKLVERKGKFGSFLACDHYREGCKHTEQL